MNIFLSLADTMSLWRDLAIAGLAGVVIGAVFLYVSLIDG